MRKNDLSFVKVHEKFNCSPEYSVMVDQITYLNAMFNFFVSNSVFTVSRFYYSMLLKYDLLDCLEFPIIVSQYNYIPNYPAIYCHHRKGSVTCFIWVKYSSVLKLLYRMDVLSDKLLCL